jgi:sugar/nucleoside kinase (ribokinase family)
MSTPRGILAAGNFIVDHVKVIDAFPEQDTLAHILEECEANGGGPYNLLKDLAAMGADYPLLACGLVGDDAKGRWILRDCAAHHINTDQLHVSALRPTSYTDAMTVRDGGRRTFFHQRGTNDLFDRSHCDCKRGSARIFYLGYLMLLGKLDAFDAEGRSEASRLLESATEAGMITAVDLVSTEHPAYRQIVLAALPHTDHLFLNELEASRILGVILKSDDPAGLIAAAEAILQLGVRRTVTIHTARGAACFSSTDGVVVQPALALPAGHIAGATGAGDAFAAGFLHGIHEGMPLTRCLRLATCCAAASLSHPSPSAGILPIADCLALAGRFGLIRSNKPRFSES